jgi:hypothetical protein
MRNLYCTRCLIKVRDMGYVFRIKC